MSVFRYGRESVDQFVPVRLRLEKHLSAGKDLIQKFQQWLSSSVALVFS